MTRDEIIKMAREVGIGIGAPPHEYSLKPYVPEDYLERLVRAAYAAGAAAEREACAKVCESEGALYDASWMSCAAAIRARGQK